ncbi:penicillin acylase family protein [Microbacterium sp. NIBRBAC000506063]|uniref:penicillin acylase family protein n=1 Tax=Microbacterium sp. NIBRBAC000506063 TaxID=2734618 RepID=UPI001BB5AA2A|nr:penicillin acylase family protein [Microbacterium sp. NIBRBAC000506063]QTV80327.1 penicillin acylase family protein [Microbacterium sp. NIBRBAC000506063]
MTSDSAALVSSLTGEVPVPSSRRGLWGKLGKTLFVVLAILVAVAVAVALFLVWTVQRSFPQTDGELHLSGLDGRVTVERDDRGIPTVTATTAHDLFFTQGFVHAQDRFWEMDFRRHVTSARVSELFGESQVGTDSFLRTLGWHRIAEEEVELLSETDRSYYEAYAAGVNSYLADRSGAELSLEYAVLGLQNPDYEPEPWTPADSVAWLKAMAWDLRTNIEAETDRALLASELGADAALDALEELYPAYPFERNPVIVPTISSVPALETRTASGPASDDETAAALAGIEWREASSVIEAASLLLGDAGEGIGSNSWVVGGSLTETGMPLLANDPHLGASLPSVWHQMQLRCTIVSEACPFDVGGFTFSGIPGVIIGHNNTVAWGFTNLTTDVADLYIEKIDGDSYWYDGELLPLEEHTETIRVAGGDDIELTVRSTVHGPIISGLTGDFTAIAEDPYVGPATRSGTSAVLPLTDAPETPEGAFAVSLRWTALDAGTTASAIFALNTAEDFDDFRYAASLFDVPAQNLIYADTEGNIGYQTPGRLPIRGAGDGWLPQPGWDSAYDWQGFIPFESLPVVYNPTSGYIVTANNAIVDTSYRYFLSRDWDYGYRAGRIAHMIERRAAIAPLTAQDMREIQADNEMWFGKRLALALGETSAERPEVQEAIELVRAWDAQNNADSDAAAYANVFFSRLAQNLFSERDVPLPVTGHARLYTVIDELFDDPENPLWANAAVGATDLDSMLAVTAEQAYDELVSLQGPTMSRWNWGGLHAITLTHDTFGTSGIAPIEALFNRGPYAVGGGASVVNATGWEIGDGYATTTVPSMRMVIDLDDFDASTWNHLTGTSGHAFHEHYTDQTDAWSRGEQQPWVFSPRAVTQSAVDTLVLLPAP